MPEAGRGVVVFGDVVASRRDVAVGEWLRAVTADLDVSYGHQRLARFDFTQGDELQGLLRLDADPFAAVLHTGLRPDARRLRWAIVAGAVEPGTGPATQRTGPAFIAARRLLAEARAGRDDLRVRTGDERADRLLANLAPLLALLVRELTPRQREVARLMLIEGLRRSDVADRLNVARATVSVLADRGRVREIGRLADALRLVFADGIERAHGIAAGPAAVTGAAP